MFNFLNSKIDFFGLDISDSSLKLARVKKRGKNIDLVSFGEKEIPYGVVKRGKVKDEEKLAEEIKEMLKIVKGERIDTEYVATSLPEEKSFFQTIKVPQMKKDQLSKVIGYEAENCIPLPIEDVYLDFQVISSIDDQIEVLVAALPKKIIDPQISALKKAGLFPVVSEVESISVARSVIKKEEQGRSILIIDIGETKTNLALFSGGVVRFTSYILISSKEFTIAISDLLGVTRSEAERLKIEYGINNREDIKNAIDGLLDQFISTVKKHISYYESCGFVSNIEKIIICGGGSKMKGLTDLLLERIGVVVEKGDPLINLSKRSRDFFNGDSLGYGVAIGLALRNFVE